MCAIADPPTPPLPLVTPGLRAGSSRPGLVYRAALEGVTFLVAAGKEQLRQHGLLPSELRVVGGGASNRLWRRIVADAFQLPLRFPLEPEAAALGGALQARREVAARPAGSLGCLASCVCRACAGRTSGERPWRQLDRLLTGPVGAVADEILTVPAPLGCRPRPSTRVSGWASSSGGMGLRWRPAACCRIRRWQMHTGLPCSAVRLWARPCLARDHAIGGRTEDDRVWMGNAAWNAHTQLSAPHLVVHQTDHVTRTRHLQEHLWPGPVIPSNRGQPVSLPSTLS